MTIKKRFVMSGVWVILIPLIGIVLTGAILMAWFFVSKPAQTVYIFDWHVMAANPDFQMLVLIWAVVSVVIAMISSTAVVFRLAGTLLRPLDDLKRAADKISLGHLDFEIMTSKYKELNELCTAFDSMRKRLQEMDLIQREYEKERNFLIANISHDLRTPITSIKGYAQGIIEGVADTPEKRSKYITTIYQKAETLEELAVSMNEYSQYEMKRIQYDLKPRDITALIRDFADECRLDLESDGIELICRIPETKIIVMLDAMKMRRVLSNIVGNAVKYKKSGSSTLQINLEKMQRGVGDGDGDGVCITIADNGIGISAEDIKRVFDSHFRGDPSRTSQVKGQGLGLSIAKQIVAAHKGKIWITSKAEEGTSVYIYIPLHSSI